MPKQSSNALDVALPTIIKDTPPMIPYAYNTCDLLEEDPESFCNTFAAIGRLRHSDFYTITFRHAPIFGALFKGSPF